MGVHSFLSHSISNSGTDHQSVGRLSSSLPLQSAPYASTSPRTLRTPYRALNALSSTQMRAPHLTLRAFSRNHLLLHTKRADCTLPLPARCPARTSPPRCFRRPRNVSRARLILGALLRTIAMQRLLLPASRAPYAQPLLSNFSTFLPPVASRAKSVWPARSCPPAAAALPESKKGVCTEVARLLSRATDVPAWKQRFL